jgi:hypothetical protein
MFKRFVLAVVLLLASLDAFAREYTDVYYNPAEAGWGVLLTQSNTFQFLTFFLYGPDGKPTWYSAQITQDQNGDYSGPLYATTGTYFANPSWQGYHINPVGTASFQPSDPYHATLTYSFTGGPTIVKAVEREPLTPYVLSGDYSGSMSGAVSNCNDPARNDQAFRGRYGLAVTQAGDQSASLTFTFVDALHSGILCTVAGPLAHFGRLYQLNGQLSCTGPEQNGTPHPVTVDALHPTGQGIEGHLAASTGGGCTASLHFSAVLNVNN